MRSTLCWRYTNCIGRWTSKIQLDTHTKSNTDRHKEPAGANGPRPIPVKNNNPMTTGSMLTIDMTGLRAFARSLEFVSTAALAELEKTMVGVGTIVKEEAERTLTDGEAAPKSVNPRHAVKALKVKVKGVDVTVSGVESFRHPLFGNKGFWYDQNMKPYLEKAFETKRDEVLAKIVLDLNELADGMLSGLWDAEGAHI